MRRTPSLLALVLVAFAASCDDTTRLIAPPDRPSAVISDGSFGGNPDFFFLPTLFPDPKKNPNFDEGKFNALLKPTVSICRLAATTLAEVQASSSCAANGTLVTFSGNQVVLYPKYEFYAAVWNLKVHVPDPHKFYRIQVFVGSTRLGFVDVSVVTSRNEARNAITGQVIPLSAGLKLPIPFRIEVGALGYGVPGGCDESSDCTEQSVTKDGGTFLTPAHHAAAQLVPGWASDAAFAAGGGTIQLTIERVTLAEGQSCHAGAIGAVYEEQDVCYHYSTDPDLAAFGGLQEPEGGGENIVGQCSLVPRTDTEEEWVLVKSDPGEPIEVLDGRPEPAGLDCANFAFEESLSSNPVLRFASLGWHSVTRVVGRVAGVRLAYAWDDGLGGHPSDFSNISWGKVLTIAKAAGDGQSANVGSPVPVNPTVTVTSHHDEHTHAAEGVDVTFTAVTGDFGSVGGTLVTTKTVKTNSDGVATAPTWYLGDVGANTLRASGLFTALDGTGVIVGDGVTFTATGTGGSRVVTSDNVAIGVNPAGHLNVAGAGSPSSGTGTTTLGLRYVPTNAEALAPGCECEGWGVADAATGIKSYANQSQSPQTDNIVVQSFSTTATTAVSVVTVGSTFEVTHDYHPSTATPYLYEVSVAIKNISAATVADVRYRRVLDWDVEPTAFDEYVTIQGTSGSTKAAAVLFASDNGFASANPLDGQSQILFSGDAVNSGPRDHGALFDFGFGSLAPGATKSFKFYYGAASSENGALSALGAIGAEVYSLGKPNRSPLDGTPNTFMIGFTGVGGNPLIPVGGPSPSRLAPNLVPLDGPLGTTIPQARKPDPRNIRRP